MISKDRYESVRSRLNMVILDDEGLSVETTEKDSVVGIIYNSIL